MNVIHIMASPKNFNLKRNSPFGGGFFPSRNQIKLPHVTTLADLLGESLITINQE